MRTGLRTHRLIRLLTDLNLPTQDYVIFGSGPMLAHRLRPMLGDLDIVARGAAWHRAATVSRPVPTRTDYGQVITLHDGAIEIFNRWLSPRWDTDALIDAAEMIEGLPFAPLDLVYRYKRELNRPKDRPDLTRLATHLTAPRRDGLRDVRAVA